nr:hypothetical protein [Tatlockia sp.]
MSHLVFNSYQRAIAQLQNRGKSVKKLIKVLTVAIALFSCVTMPPIAQTSAQTQISPAQELQKLLQQAVKQTELGQLQQSLDTLQKA